MCQLLYVETSVCACMPATPPCANTQKSTSNIF